MKGLSFSGPMVLAWLDGRKTVTRRLMNPQPDFSGSKTKRGPNTVPIEIRGDEFHEIKPRYHLFETVYIKETWAAETEQIPLPYRAIWYKADDNTLPISWKSPRFMPEWAARSHARIVSVIPERLHEINEVDAYCEGFRDQLRGETFWPVGAQFKEIWDKIHPGTWDQNPWVWVISLERID
jgi:hypothetical protein